MHRIASHAAPSASDSFSPVEEEEVRDRVEDLGKQIRWARDMPAEGLRGFGEVLATQASSDSSVTLSLPPTPPESPPRSLPQTPPKSEAESPASEAP